MDNPIYESYARLESILTDSFLDASKFVNGNNSAGTRVRKVMQEVKSIAQKIRLEVQEQKNQPI
jgi:phage-related protein